MTQPQQPFEGGPNTPTQPYRSNATAPAPNKKFGLGAVIATAAVSALAGASLLLVFNQDTGNGEDQAWPTQQQLEEVAADGFAVSAEDYRWLTFATCGAYSTFGAYHYVLPEQLVRFDRSGIRATQASLAKMKDEQSGKNLFAKDMPDSARGPVDWPAGIAGLSNQEKLGLIDRVASQECFDLKSQVGDRLMDGTGVAE